jgi:hypothetical protein
VQQTVAASPLYTTYGFAIDRESAYEMLAARVAQAQLAALAAAPVPTPRAAATPAARATTTRRTAQKQPDNLMEQVLGSAAVKGFAQSIGKELSRSIFGTGRRR